jgi:hypothetical protein
MVMAENLRFFAAELARIRTCIGLNSTDRDRLARLQALSGESREGKNI